MKAAPRLLLALALVAGIALALTYREHLDAATYAPEQVTALGCKDRHRGAIGVAQRQHVVGHSKRRRARQRHPL